MCSDELTAQTASKLKQIRGWAKMPANQIGGDTQKRIEAGKCVGCGNKMPEDIKVYHTNCAGNAKKVVKRDAKHAAKIEGLKSSMDINNTHLDKYGRNQLGVRHFGCGCNAQNAQHGKFCKHAGQQISDKLRKGLE